MRKNGREENAQRANPEVVAEVPDIRTEGEYKPFDFPKSEFRNPNEGWICPRCQTCWSPDVLRCDCIADEIVPEKSYNRERVEK